MFDKNTTYTIDRRKMIGIIGVTTTTFFAGCTGNGERHPSLVSHRTAVQR